MRNEILKFIAKETYGESYRVAKIELDVEIDSVSRIEYEAPAETVINRSGETKPTKKPVPLKNRADEISASGLQILNYFLDGTRRVYKVDEIAYVQSQRKNFYPIVAAQVTTGCCRRVDKKLHAESLSDEIILALPNIANANGNPGFFPALVTKLNTGLAEKKSSIKISKIVEYGTDKNIAEKFEERAIVKILEHMHNAEIDLVAKLVKRGRLDKKNYLVKDGSIEYRTLPGRNFNAKNYNFVIGVSKKFNPTLIKDSSGKFNPGIVADLPIYHRTPVTIIERGNFHGDKKFAVWYVRLRGKKFTDSPFDGVVKVEKILVTDAELESNKIDSDTVNMLSACLINERNPVCYGTDSRWANHIYPIFLTEIFIKSRSISAETFLNLF